MTKEEMIHVYLQQNIARAYTCENSMKYLYSVFPGKRHSVVTS